ncbi:hypothetical protein [Sphaerisporangium rufum]|uniref:hypothetical protein n=1 Tax=Sphaerisporangium rufum TaxID=1381558 RepID=UPI00194F497E|nr:hypothetical protein [Sphaerisporangium rufum]
MSCTGKTTLAGSLAERLGWEVMDCYFHVAPDPSSLGRPIATSEAEQLASLAAHFPVEAQRHRQALRAAARDGGVILDRTINTLLAHVRAVGRLQDLNATVTARAMVAQQIAAGAATVPDLTLLLIGDAAVLADRATLRPDLPAIYYVPAFARHFNAHFEDPIGRCVRLDATAAPGAVVDAALAAISLVQTTHARRR